MQTAKVARVLNSTDLALNKGSDDHVQVGDRFAILNDKEHEITDPDTGEVLESVPIAKTVVKVVAVYPKLAIARTFRVKRTGGLSFMPAFSTKERERHETLKSDSNRLQEELSVKDSYIDVGDEAMEFEGEFKGVIYEF
jgi:hypothetical protein